jgi:anthranilate synthase component 1
MKDGGPATGAAVALCRHLASDPDPLALYAALTANGERADTLLFEQMTGPTFVLDRAAVRIECRGCEASVVALSPNGQNLLSILACRMEDRLVERDSGKIRLRFPLSDCPDADERLKAPSPYDLLREISGLAGGAIVDEPYGLLVAGIIAFDHVDLFERLPIAAEDRVDFPDLLFWVAESLVLFETGSRPRAIATAFGVPGSADARQAYFDASARLVQLVERSADASAVRLQCSGAAGDHGDSGITDVDLDDEAYAELVREMKRHVAEGEVYQIVLSRTFRTPCSRPLAAFGAQREADPSPYSFFVSAADFRLFGASPETSVRVFAEDGERKVELKPIAGTRPRGLSPDEDNRLEAELRLDQKEQAEHVMLVDLARNDVARISTPGSRRVEQFMQVERYARVMHLVSSVVGHLRPDLDSTHALKACLNMGTLTGAPKIRATQLLRQAERTKRGPYGGTIGWLNGQGLMDSAIVIRTATVKDGTAFVRAGAGIVHDSDPLAEAAETRRKAEALLSAIHRSER